jgi:aspartate 1-decarboxylase
LARHKANGSRAEERSSHMLVHILKSKIHRASVTAASVDYEGSLTIAEDLIEAAGLVPYERILCSNMANGARWETYVIKGPRSSGAIELNGAVAHLGKPGDRITIMSFTEIEQHQASAWAPTVIVLGEANLIVNTRGK